MNYDTNKAKSSETVGITAGIAPDDLKKGDFVMLKDKRSLAKSETVTGTNRFGRQFKHTTTETQTGPEDMTCELFEVLEVSWPIVLLSEILVGGELKPPQNIDIRKITCLRISDAYVKAVKSFDPLRDVEVKK